MEVSRLSSVSRQRPLSSYTSADINSIKLLSFYKGAVPFGSATYVIQKYPGDLDLYETVELEGRVDQVIHKFAKILKRKVKEIEAADPPVYITEIKAGSDPNYELPIGPLVNGIWTPNNENLRKMLGGLPYMGELDGPSQKKYYEISEKVRNLKTLRWSPTEIKEGFLVHEKDVISLEKALHSKSHIKIDTITWLDGRFTEVTNFLLLGAVLDGKLHLVNTSYDYRDHTQLLKSYEDNLRDEIEKLSYSPDFNIFKATKRMWAFSRVFQDVSLSSMHGREYRRSLEKLTPIVSGNISMIYQIKSEIDAILLVLPCILVEKSYKKHLLEQIEKWKVAFSHVVEWTTPEMEDFIRIAEMTKKLKSRYFEVLKDNLKEKINSMTLKELRIIGYYPIPSIFLPHPRRYL